MQTTVPTPNPANPKHCGEVEFPVLLPEHDGYPIRPGRLTPATTPFVETRRIPKPRITTPTINDSRRIPAIDLPPSYRPTERRRIYCGSEPSNPSRERSGSRGMVVFRV